MSSMRRGGAGGDDASAAISALFDRNGTERNFSAVLGVSGGGNWSALMGTFYMPAMRSSNGTNRSNSTNGSNMTNGSTNVMAEGPVYLPPVVVSCRVSRPSVDFGFELLVPAGGGACLAYVETCIAEECPADHDCADFDCELPPLAGDLTVVVDELRNPQGTVRIALVQDVDAWNSGMFLLEYEELPANMKTTVTIGGCVPPCSLPVVFPNMPFGAYGFCVHHDEDTNEEMTLNWVGLPKEGICCSNGATGGPWGGPRFSDAVFLHVGPTEERSSMWYFL